MLGGLLEDSYQQGEDKVPLMGDIPVLGNLFRSESRSRKKTNLMVFLRPVVVRDAAASDALMIDRYDAIRALQYSAQPAPNLVMGSVNGAPLLPPLPAPASNAQAVQTSVPMPLPLPLAPTTAPRAQPTWSAQPQPDPYSPQ